MKKNLILAMLFWTTILSIQAQTIPANFFGINYWMPNQIPITSSSGSPNGYVNYAPIQQLVSDAGAQIYRIGGDPYDVDGTDIGTGTAQNDYTVAMANVIAQNADASFLVQVPYKAWGAWSSTNETNVQTLVTNVENYRNSLTPIPDVYYAIGNEWDLYSSPPTCSTIQAQIKAYAVSMKKVQSYNIKIVGPSVTNFWAQDGTSPTTLNILQNLIGGTYDITGIIPSGNGNATGRPYIDVVDYHSYSGGCNGDMSGAGSCASCPYRPANTCIGVYNSGSYSEYRSRGIDYPNGGSSFSACGSGVQGGCSFKDELSNGTLVGSVKGMQKLINDANTTHNRVALGYPLTFALTEINIASKAPPNPTGTNPEDNSVIGLGPRSFFAGQYWVAMFVSILQNIGSSAEFAMPWSIHESGGNGSTSDLGMTKGTASSTQAPLPLSTYYHYQLMAKNFSGTYFSNNATVQANYKAFACSTASEIRVIIMNQNEQSPRGTDNGTNTVKIDFNGGTPSGADMLFSFATGNTVIGSSGVYNCNMTKETSMLLAFNITSGTLVKKEVYHLGHALRTNDTGPEAWYLGTGTPIATQATFDGHFDAVYTDLKIAPNPSAITEGSSDTKTFRFTNTATIDGVNGAFTVPVGGTFILIPSSTCP